MSKNSVTYIFGDESGDFKTKPYFIIGFIRTETMDIFEKKIKELRQKYDFHFEIKYSSTNKLKIPLSKAIVDLFFNSTGLEFRSIVKSNLIFDLSYFRRSKIGIPAKDLAYNKTYREVIEHNTAKNERVIVYIDDKSRLKADNLLEYLKKQIPQVRDVQPRNSKDLQLLQLADLVTGSIYGDLTGNNHPVKRELISYILDYLPIKSFTEKMSTSKFNIWHWKPNKNARRMPNPDRSQK
ncbi:MAG: DUF3800 domain-containing protein [Candidatus Cloacimonetes bacterium]|nr:DUF3800 domain-containing protein [Candidatus Cloacimonadota bacterium]